MSRSLHNSLNALAATGAALVAALVLASPVPPATTAPAIAGDTPDLPLALADALGRGVTDAVPVGRGGSDIHQHRRIAMPYFSFLPRG